MAKESIQILYAVLGGHGGQPFMDWWIFGDSTISHNILLNTVDSGGHTGIIRQLFPDILPPGDLRSNIGSIIKRKGILTKNPQLIKIGYSIAEEFTDNINEVEPKTIALASHIINRSDISNSKIILKTIKKFSEEYTIRFKKRFKNTKISHKIGNILIAALVYENQKKTLDSVFDLDLINNLFKNDDLIPSNLNFYFCFNKALKLIAKDANGKKLNSEAEVDESKIQVHPQNLSVINTSRQQVKSLQICKYLESLIQKSKLVIIPTGSPANSYPYISMLKDVLKSKLIIRVANAVKATNDIDFISEIHYLINQLNLSVLCLSTREWLNKTQTIFNVLESYAKESKEVQLTPANHEMFLEIFKRLQHDGIKLSSYIELDNISNSILPVFDIVVFNQKKTASIKSKDYAIKFQKGIRHIPGQLMSMLEHIANLNQAKLDALKNSKEKASIAKKIIPDRILYNE